MKLPSCRLYYILSEFWQIHSRWIRGIPRGFANPYICIPLVQSPRIRLLKQEKNTALGLLQLVYIGIHPLIQSDISHIRWLFAICHSLCSSSFGNPRLQPSLSKNAPRSGPPPVHDLIICYDRENTLGEFRYNWRHDLRISFPTGCKICSHDRSIYTHDSSNLDLKRSQVSLFYR